MTTEVSSTTVPIYLAGEFVTTGTPLEIRNPASGELVATTFQAGPAELDRATQAAVEAFGADPRPGELRAARHPHARGGSHLPGGR